MANLSPENVRFIEQLLQQGTYASEQEALNDAVTLLKKRDELRSAVRAGIDQADSGELLPAEEVFGRLEKRASEIEATARKNG